MFPSWPQFCIGERYRSFFLGSVTLEEPDGCSIFALGNSCFLSFLLACTFIDPSMAIVTEVLGPNYQVQRFGGLGHPNVVGRIAVFLGCCYLRVPCSDRSLGSGS